jgi:hypothetical protein
VLEEARCFYKPFRFGWLSMGLASSAAWNITLANAALLRSLNFGHKLKSGVETNQDALKYYTLSLGSITKRLDDPAESESEGIVVAVTGCACHDV